jgi:hypothetical protein
MEPECSIPNSQELSTCPYPELDQSSPHRPNLSLKRSILILSTHLRFGLPSGLLPSGFPTNNLHAFFFSPIRATCRAHLILYRNLWPFHTIYNSLQHTVSLLSLHQSSGTGSQWQTFPFLWVPELTPCLSHRNSQLTHSKQRHSHSRLTPLHQLSKLCLHKMNSARIKARVMLRLTVNAAVCFDVRHPSEHLFTQATRRQQSIDGLRCSQIRNKT